MAIGRWVAMATVIAAVAAPAQPAGAQHHAEDARRAVQEILQEKLRVPIERLTAPAAAAPSAAVNGAAPAAGHGAAAAPEVIVSDDALPESEVHAAINPVNPANIVVSAIRLDRNNQTEMLLCPVYVSTDFGVSWTKSGFRTLPAETGMVAGGGDPVFAFDADGTLYFSWIDLYFTMTSKIVMAMYWAWSSDGGVTWTREANDRIGQSMMSAAATEAFDKQWLAADRSSSPWRNTLYAAFFHPDSNGLKIGVRRKTPASTAFTQTSVNVSGAGFKAVQFASIGVDPAGGVHVTFFGSTDSIAYALWHARSDDGGASFGVPVKISGVNCPRFSANDRQGTVPGIDNARVYPCPHLVVDESAGAQRGFLYAVWSGNGIDAKDGNGMDVFFSRSTDNGDSWTPALVVNDDTRGLVRDQFHPSIAVNGNGVIAVTWYDRRDDAANAVARTMYAESFDGGLSFTRSLAVASQPMNMLRAGSQNGNFGIGEYTQVLMTADYVIPFWADGRSDDGNLNVYGAFIPVNASTGAERLVSVAGGCSLSVPSPNPAAGSAVVRYTLDVAASMRLTLSDALGRSVRVLREGAETGGEHRLELPLRSLARGTYYLTLQSGTGVAVQTLIVE